MELIKFAARRTRISEVVYTLLNMAYAGLVLLLLLEFEGQPYLAYLVVILSKWRVFAVRARFWLANIRTNLLDTLVGLSVVTLLWQNMGNIIYQLVVTLLFAAWLVLLKPQSKHFWVVVQGGVAQFLGLTALFTIAYALGDFVVVLLAWVIGAVTARHIINIFNDEYEDVTISIIWGTVVAELAWLLHHWTIAYTAYKIPQASIVISLLGFMVLVVYNYLYHHEDNRRLWRDVGMPIMFSLSGIALLLVFFNGFDPTTL